MDAHTQIAHMAGKLVFTHKLSKILLETSARVISMEVRVNKKTRNRLYVHYFLTVCFTDTPTPNSQPIMVSGYLKRNQGEGFSELFLLPPYNDIFNGLADWEQYDASRHYAAVSRAIIEGGDAMKGMDVKGFWLL